MSGKKTVFRIAIQPGVTMRRDGYILNVPTQLKTKSGRRDSWWVSVEAFELVRVGVGWVAAMDIAPPLWCPEMAHNSFLAFIDQSTDHPGNRIAWQKAEFARAGLRVLADGDEVTAEAILQAARQLERQRDLPALVTGRKVRAGGKKGGPTPDESADQQLLRRFAELMAEKPNKERAYRKLAKAELPNAAEAELKRRAAAIGKKIWRLLKKVRTKPANVQGEVP